MMVRALMGTFGEDAGFVPVAMTIFSAVISTVPRVFVT
jgi:hypothetical protein